MSHDMIVSKNSRVSAHGSAGPPIAACSQMMARPAGYDEEPADG
jgi:hypothetical protein